MSSMHRLCINLPASVYADLAHIAAQRRTTMTEVIRLALSLVKMEDDARREGLVLGLVDRNGKVVRELIVPY